MSEPTITTTPGVRLAALVETLPMDSFSMQIGPMFGRATELLLASGAAPELPIATYQMVDGDQMTVVVGYQFDGEVAPEGLGIVDLPQDEVAQLTYRGAPDGIGAAWQQLHEWIAAQGKHPDAAGRELYVDSADMNDMDNWVTELQQPIGG